MKFQAVKGTRDFYPDKMAFRNWLFNKMRKVSKIFGYEEYEGPILEPLALYAAKSSEELVKEQTFILKDRGGQELSLRPELTPTLARMVAEKQAELKIPIRWFSIGPFWRYEQPQKGRTREFFQWNVDLIGWNLPEADAEVITIAATLFKELGLSSKEIRIKVNNRRFMDQKFTLMGIPKNLIPKLFKAIDKKDKMEETKWEEYVKEIGLTPLQIEDLKRVLKDKDYSNESEELTDLFSTLSDLGVSEYVELDPTTVRGLDYYTGTVFEARDTSGELRSILGGGRYDNLVEVVGGKPLSGVGFAAGDVLLELVLQKYNKIPTINANPTQTLVTIFDESSYRSSLSLATFLRNNNVNTEIYLDSSAKLEKQLKYADQKGIPYVIIIGPEETQKNLITVKDMINKEQKQIKKEQLIPLLKSAKLKVQNQV